MPYRQKRRWYFIYKFWAPVAVAATAGLVWWNFPRHHSEPAQIELPSRDVKSSPLYGKKIKNLTFSPGFIDSMIFVVGKENIIPADETEIYAVKSSYELMSGKFQAAAFYALKKYVNNIAINRLSSTTHIPPVPPGTNDYVTLPSDAVQEIMGYLSEKGIFMRVGPKASAQADEKNHFYGDLSVELRFESRCTDSGRTCDAAGVQMKFWRSDFVNGEIRGYHSIEAAYLPVTPKIAAVLH